MRLFVAIELPDAVKDHLSRLCAGVRGARWVDSEQMHLTLRFIGDVDSGQAHDIAVELGQVRAERFALGLSGLGDFSSRGRAATLWVGVRANAALETLQARIESAVRRAGVAPESRNFHPHVTLARFARDRSAKDFGGRPDLGRYYLEHEPFSLPPFPVEEFALFSSVLGSEGAHHTMEAAYPLTLAAAV